MSEQIIYVDENDNPIELEEGIYYTQTGLPSRNFKIGNPPLLRQFKLLTMPEEGYEVSIRLIHLPKLPKEKMIDSIYYWECDCGLLVTEKSFEKTDPDEAKKHATDSKGNKFDGAKLIQVIKDFHKKHGDFYIVRTNSVVHTEPPFEKFISWFENFTEGIIFGPSYTLSYEYSSK